MVAASDLKANVGCVQSSNLFLGKLCKNIKKIKEDKEKTDEIGDFMLVCDLR